MKRQAQHHTLPANSETVHWGYFSKDVEPRLSVISGDFITIETLSHHANDDASLMVNGDPGAESVFRWNRDGKGVDRRGAGPVDATLFGRGAGEGLGVHILTGPVYIEEAEPGDIVEVRILDLRPRPSANPDHRGK
ncbi:MAG: acetamidase/formamidase family protein, partial [Gammaproteobacteria bacterium]|nr:acetamidase/formamidase family protein [Gammaproteobacteria bacterium]